MAKKKYEGKSSSASSKIAKVMAVTMAVTPVVAVLPGMVSAVEANEASVANLEQLIDALADSQIDTIDLTADIPGVGERLVVNRVLTINGNDHTISYTDAVNNSTDGTRHGIAVQASGVTINNLKVAMTQTEGWQGVYALQVYNSTGVTINNFTGSGADAALLVNASAVTLKGTTTVTGNEFGGIEVSKGVDGTANAELTVDGILVNGSEAIGQPTIWVIDNQGTVTNNGSTPTTSTAVEGGKTYYYLTAAATEANVGTIDELQAALANSQISTIKLTANIEGVTERLVVNRALTINGDDKTISFTGVVSAGAPGTRHGIAVQANNVTINDLKVDMKDKADAWQGVYALQVYNAIGVTINNFTGSGADAALLVNASTVTLKGTTTVTGNEFGGIEVSRGVDGTANAELTVDGILVNGSEAIGQPTIWVIDNQGTVTNNGSTPTTSTAVEGGKTYYYLTAAATETSVETLGELQAALANSQISTIKLTANIEGVTERLVVNRALTINGNGHTIRYTDAVNNSSDGTRHGIAVEASGVIINNLNVAMTAESGWQGVYALQVYNATGVTLNNFTGSGADAALLVNASTVTLKGTTTVTGNEFGGIEVSKGVDGTANAELTVDGILVNGSEAIGQPTIWVIDNQGTVTNNGSTPTTSTAVQGGKTYYYLTAAVTETSVETLGELQAALANSQFNTINLTANIDDVAERLVVNRALTINGNGHTIRYTDAVNNSTNGTRHGIAVQASGVTINNLKVAMTEKTGWQGVYALQVYNATGVTLNNFTGSGADAALLVNASTVTLEGTTTVTGNEFGGIEVSRGVDGTTNGQLNVTGSLVNGSESGDQPTIWVVDGQGAVANTGSTRTTSMAVEGGKTYYYLVTAVTEASVGTVDELQAVLANSQFNTINLTANIDDVAERLVVNRALTINGNGHTISYTDAINNSPYGTRQGIAVEASGVIINNLNVAMTAESGWQGVYALQVYNSTGVTINNFTGSGADAALLVNASTVTLEGTTTVTGNEFGGIEVSKGEDGTAEAHLIVTGSLINNDEAIRQPTIWVVDGQGEVTFNGPLLTASTTVKEGQTHYYLTAVQLSSLEITSPAAKLTYNVGEDLDITGLEVTGTYSDGSKKIETIGEANVTGFDNTAAGEQTLTVTVGGKTVTYTVTVQAAESTTEAYSIEAPQVTVNGLSANVVAKINKESTANEPVTVIFQLMNGNKPVKLIAIKDNITNGQEVHAQFDLPASGNYTVKVLIWDDLQNQEAKAQPKEAAIASDVR